MPRIVLLCDIPRSTPNSMDRYANSIGLSLQRIIGNDWSVKEIIPHLLRINWGSEGKFSKVTKLEENISRFLLYPVNVFFKAADIYHIIDHSYGQLAYPLYKRPVVVTCHDLIPLRAAHEGIPDFRVKAFSATKFRWAVMGMRLADIIIAVSESTKRDIVEFLGIPEHKIRVVHNGVDSKFKEIDDENEIRHFKHSREIPLDAHVIMHVSNKDLYKNVKGVLRTLAVLVHELDQETHLLRVGSALDEEHWELARSLEIDHYIHEAGYLTDTELVLAYNAAMVLLYPSWLEGFGFPPLEAMACGTPVVASNRASLPEVVGEAGVLLPPDDHRGMAREIKRIREDAHWRTSLIKKGRKRSSGFSWEKAAEETFRIYGEVLKNSSRNR
jgi:glycosyltransferase involved in cell wall biosynthesis